jgi:hypothetical protein
MFLNQNKEKANKHKQVLEKMKQDLKALKDAYRKYTESGDQGSQLSSAIKQCYEMLSQIKKDNGKSVYQSVSIEGKEFSFCDPNNL